MANPRQRRKSRSGAANGPSAAAKRHQKKKLVRAPTVKGPSALKDKWDGKKTVRQNYAALGLLSDLKMRPSGGLAPGTQGGADLLLAPLASSSSKDASGSSGSGSGSGSRPAKGMGRIIRDAEGNVVDIIEGSEEPEETPWGRPMRGWEDQEAEEADKEMDIQGMSPYAAREESEVVKALQTVPDPGPLLRHVSELEAYWLLSLVRRHGEDVDAMFMDKRLNENQKTKGEIRSRIKRAGGFAPIRTAIASQDARS